MLLPLYKYRQFIWRQALVDLRHRYAGTGLGMAWNVIHPLGIIAIYSVVFTVIFRSTNLPDQTGRLPFTIYLCSGFFPWLAFSECVTRGCNAFVANAQYLRRLSIPEIVFAAQSSVSTALCLGINFTLVALVALALGHTPYWTWLLIPVPLVMLLCLGFSLGFLLGILNVFFRDIGEWVQIILPIVMWTVPIVYTSDLLPKSLKSLVPWHPVAPAIEAVHELFLRGRMPNPSLWFGMIIWPAAFLLIGLLSFSHLRSEMRDLL